MLNTAAREKLFESPEMKAQYAIEYPDYVPGPEAVQKLKSLFQDIKVTIVLGTWCSDCRRQVPRLYKVLDEAGFLAEQITLIFVDESKKASGGLTDHLNIDKVPTFIFTENGKEIGRITESPLVTLESDMIEILTK
ncbi:thioredoxin family protein [Pedobacter cryoconitis]|uniref:Thiol-disulfide isomerase/thioredoxin n=1 Tax=Pedobacter cryoconitis TaxID=188932 RepID=A0A327TAI2_9SPHI|nr:thioredoxin family protein [Pedobacter cryoconitis]RAJ37114.1 thiol-disulfide isomerase/thioredoxin [Pedobacter cryoconitis]